MSCHEHIVCKCIERSHAHELDLARRELAKAQACCRHKETEIKMLKARLLELSEKTARVIQSHGDESL